MEKDDNHICNPQVTMTFDLKTYQCGCGRYFNEKVAIEQNKRWMSDQCKQFRKKKTR